MLIQGVPGFTQKGLEVSQNDPAGPRGSSGGFRGSCCLLEESGDVLELPWGPQGGPGVIQKGLEMSQRGLFEIRGSPGVPGVLQRSPMGILRTTSHSDTFSLCFVPLGSPPKCLFPFKSILCPFCCLSFPISFQKWMVLIKFPSRALRKQLPPGPPGDTGTTAGSATTGTTACPRSSHCHCHRGGTESQNGPGWKGPPGSQISSPPPQARPQTISYQPRLPRAPSSLALNTSRDGRGIHSLSGSCSSTSPLSLRRTSP